MRPLALLASILVIAATVSGCGGSRSQSVYSVTGTVRVPMRSLFTRANGWPPVPCTRSHRGSRRHCVRQALFVLGPAPNPSPVSTVLAWLYKIERALIP